MRRTDVALSACADKADLGAFRCSMLVFRTFKVNHFEVCPSMSLQLKSLALSGFAFRSPLSLPAFAQTTIIEGVVKDPDGKPVRERSSISNAPISKEAIRSRPTKRAIMATTACRWEKFDVSVLVDGEVKDPMKGVPTTPAMPANVNFDLKAPRRPLPPVPPAPPKLRKGHDEGAEGSTTRRPTRLAKLSSPRIRS